MDVTSRGRSTIFAIASVFFVMLGFVAFFSRPNSPSPTTFALPLAPSSSIPPRPSQSGVDCGAPSSFASAADNNTASISTLGITPFKQVEIGWAAYGPMIAREIGAACEPTSAQFAARLADWQTAHSLAGTGEMDATTIAAMANVWLMRRPFVAASKIECPDAPNAETLMRTDPAEAFGGKTISARIDALAAYRRMAAAMRGEPGAEAAALKIASAYRDPIEEAARCADGGCGTPAKARCSAHRTGLAFDFYLGAAPGLDPFSTDPANRLFISRTPTYRWLVKNADRFGFVNYPYEPWHWEWTGEPKQDRTR